ncbi:MAG: hypothetical protein E6G05_13550 [Actinobacteria bacterium]|nr:MAG: hypothetical protein E6G05_13550 [Actinomycetota bacterium]
MSYELFVTETLDALSRADTTARITEGERSEIAMAQVFATLALAAAIREGLVAAIRPPRPDPGPGGPLANA